MQVDPRAWKRAFLVWLATLVMFAIPRPGTTVPLKTVFHQPLFLVIAPIVLAGLSLFVPVKDDSDESETEVSNSYRPRRRRSDTWKGIIGCIILALFVAFLLLAFNADVAPKNTDSVHRLNNAGGVALALLLGLTIYFARDFKRQ